jgi:hypothetical protein
MDIFTTLFWIGSFVLVVSHVLLFQAMPRHSTIALTGFALMFVGSKLGREFLGIKKSA